MSADGPSAKVLAERRSKHIYPGTAVELRPRIPHHSQTSKVISRIEPCYKRYGKVGLIIPTTHIPHEWVSTHYRFLHPLDVGAFLQLKIQITTYSWSGVVHKYQVIAVVRIQREIDFDNIRQHRTPLRKEKIVPSTQIHREVEEDIDRVRDDPHKIVAAAYRDRNIPNLQSGMKIRDHLFRDNFRGEIITDRVELDISLNNDIDRVTFPYDVPLIVPVISSDVAVDSTTTVAVNFTVAATTNETTTTSTATNIGTTVTTTNTKYR